VFCKSCRLANDGLIDPNSEHFFTIALLLLALLLLVALPEFKNYEGYFN